MMITNVLFVTAASDTLKDLQKLQLDRKETLLFFFAQSNDDALNVICENNITIVVTDLRIRKFNHLEFLSILQDSYPKIFRVCLVSDNEKVKAIRLSKSIHRSVKIPLDHAALLKTMNDLAKLVVYDLNAHLIEKINGLGAIPILPDIYLRLEKELCMSVFSMNRIAEIIQADPWMVARILHIAHSSFYNIPAGVTNLLQALNFLGVNIVKTLVLYVKVFSLRNASPETQSVLKEIKTHSINVAKFSKAMMEKETNDKDMIEQAYISGLLHDVGKIVLLQLNDKQKHSPYFQNIHTSNSHEMEQKLFGVSHINVGSYILRLWAFQDEIIEAVAGHHDSTILNNKALSLKEIVFTANAFSHEFEEMSLSISKSYGSDKFDQWDQLFKDDIRPALNLPI